MVMKKKKKGRGDGNGKHYLITSNLKSNCVVLLSILLLVSAFGWILFIRFTLIHTQTRAHRISLAHTCTHTQPGICVRAFFYYFDFSLPVLRVSSCFAVAQLFFCVIPFSSPLLLTFRTSLSLNIDNIEKFPLVFSHFSAFAWMLMGILLLHKASTWNI